MPRARRAAGASETIAVAKLPARIATAAADGSRLLVAIAGPPCAGKSTLAARLQKQLDLLLGEPVSIVVGMDGFHLDDTLLVPAGLRPRKGAPETFDIDGLAHALRRLRTARSDVVVPLFDRSIEIARAGALVVETQHRIVIVEGNYLLLDQPKWSSLRELFHLTVYIDVPEKVLRKRARERWSDMPPDEVRAKIEGNDMPNARLIAQTRLQSDLVVTDNF